MLSLQPLFEIFCQTDDFFVQSDVFHSQLFQQVPSSRSAARHVRPLQPDCNLLRHGGIRFEGLSDGYRSPLRLCRFSQFSAIRRIWRI